MRTNGRCFVLIKISTTNKYDSENNNEEKFDQISIKQTEQNAIAMEDLELRINKVKSIDFLFNYNLCLVNMNSSQKPIENILGNKL